MIDMSQHHEAHGRAWMAVMEHNGSGSQSAQLRGAFAGAGYEIVPAVFAIIIAALAVAAIAVALDRRGVSPLKIGAGIFAALSAAAAVLIVAA